MGTFFFDVYGCSMAAEDRKGTDFPALAQALGFANSEMTKIAQILIDRSEPLNAVIVIREADRRPVATLSLLLRTTT